MASKRAANDRLAALLREAGLSHESVARAFVRVAHEAGLHRFGSVGRSHVSHWVAGTRPAGQAPEILREALSRRLGRPLSLRDLGLEGPGTASVTLATDDGLWGADTLQMLAALRREDEMSWERRSLFKVAAYSTVALSAVNDRWWEDSIAQATDRMTSGSAEVGRGDVAAVREMVAMFSAIDQRRGGDHARTTAARYLTGDVARYLNGRCRTSRVRQDLFSAASELAYIVGWMAFDSADHAGAQRFFTVAIKLAAEADDPPMAGHVLRAMAHQAVDLGHHRQGLDLATASVSGRSYRLAVPRERALLGVVHARTLAATGQQRAAAQALLQAEGELSAAGPDHDEPSRVFFFGEASLAHQTACTLREGGDLDGALAHFERSARTRTTQSFTRTHAVTLGHLGEVMFHRGEVEQACDVWSDALDAMDGVRSGRTRQSAVNMRTALSALRGRSLPFVAQVDARARQYLAATA